MTPAEDVRTAIDAADRKFMDAFNAGDVEGAARGVYTDDAILMPPGAETVRGREGIVSFWGAAAQALGVERVELSTVELTDAGDFVHQVGRVTLTLAGGERPTGKYAVLWKEEDDAWRWYVDIWNMDA